MKRRIAWFSSLPGLSPPSSAAAYVTKILLPRLEGKFEIDLYHDTFETYAPYPTFHYLSAFRRHRARPYDVFLYHIEDSDRSRFARSHAGLFPGITWFHNLNCFDDGPPTLWASPWRTMIRRFQGERAAWENYDDIPRKEGKILTRETSMAPVALFSTAQAHAEYQRTVGARLCGEETQSWMIPYPVEKGGVLESSSEREVVSVALCGAPRIEHRVHKVLPALRDLSQKLKVVWLIDSSERAEAERYARESGVAQLEFIEGKSPDAWRAVVRHADVAVHPIFSVFAEPYPWALISLSEGVPAVMSLFGSSEDIPESLVYHVEPGATERYQMKIAIERALEERGSKFREARREYIAEFHEPDCIARELSDVIDGAIPFISGMMKKWSRFQGDARNEMLESAEHLVSDPRLIDFWSRARDSIARD